MSPPLAMLLIRERRAKKQQFIRKVKGDRSKKNKNHKKGDITTITLPKYQYYAE